MVANAHESILKQFVWSVCVYSFGYGGHADRPHPTIQLAIAERDLGLYLCDDAAIKQVSKSCYIYLLSACRSSTSSVGGYRLILFVCSFLPRLILPLAVQQHPELHLQYLRQSVRGGHVAGSRVCVRG